MVIVKLERANRAISLGVAAVVVIIVILIVGFGVYFNATFNTTSSTGVSTITSSSTSTSTTTTSSSNTSTGATVILQQGATYQVPSSYDCVAGHSTEAFNVTTTSYLEGGINATQPGVMVYVSTAQEAETTSMGHPTEWLYSSGLTNSTSFNVLLSPGSYVFWTEGADLGCGATVVTPLEELTTVTITQTVMLTTTPATS